MVFSAMSLSVRFMIGKLVVGRSISISSLPDTFSVGSCLFLWVLVLVFLLGSLNSKQPPPHLFYTLFLNKRSQSFSATLSICFLSCRVGTHTFHFQLLSTINQRLPGLAIRCLFSNNPKVSGLLSCLLFLSNIFPLVP